MSSLNVLLGGEWVCTTLEYDIKPDGSAIVPASGLSTGALVPSVPPTKIYDLKGGEKTSLQCITQLDGHFRLDLTKIDAYQERSPPYKNAFADKSHYVEVLTSLRHISISYKGQEIAASDRWFALFEGSASGGKEYPLRYYIPKGDVKVTLQPSDTKSHCPFKGDAVYYKLDGQDLVWAYPTPTTGACKSIADSVCFYLEKDGFSHSIEGGEILYPKQWQFDD